MASARQPGFYERRIFPWLNDKLTASPEIARLRTDALAAARGHVVEIGFGSGLHLPHYPSAVDAITAVEPNPGMHARARANIRASKMPVTMLLAEAEHLPLADGSADTAVSTLVLCSVAEPARALAELRRVLRAGGRLIVMEHGLSDDPGVARWQRRLNGIQNVVACGCNLNRPVADLVEAAGFRFESVQRFYVAGAPRTHGWLTVGVANLAGNPKTHSRTVGR